MGALTAAAQNEIRPCISVKKPDGKRTDHRQSRPALAPEFFTQIVSKRYYSARPLVELKASEYDFSRDDEAKSTIRMENVYPWMTFISGNQKKHKSKTKSNGHKYWKEKVSCGPITKALEAPPPAPSPLSDHLLGHPSPPTKMQS